MEINSSHLFSISMVCVFFPAPFSTSGVVGLKLKNGGKSQEQRCLTTPGLKKCGDCLLSTCWITWTSATIFTNTLKSEGIQMYGLSMPVNLGSLESECRQIHSDTVQKMCKAFFYLGDFW